MGSYSIGEALQQLLEKSQWKHKMYEVKLREEWEQIVGKTIAKYTDNLYLNAQSLIIYTSVAVLKQEINLSKANLIQQINDYLGEKIIKDITVK